jgi:hypothetical protein
MSEHLDNYIIHELTIEDPDEHGDQTFHGIFEKIKEGGVVANPTKPVGQPRRMTRKKRTRSKTVRDS